MADRVPFQGRAQVDQRDLYGYTTPRIDVTSRPTDPYVQPTFSSGTRSLLTSLSSMQTGLQGYVQYKEAKNAKDFEEGYTTRGKDEELDEAEKKSKAFLSGWETLDGKVKAKTDYMNEVSEYANQNKHLTPEEFKAGLSEIEKKYLEGSSDSFIKGFLPDALEIEAKTLNAYQANLNAEYWEKLIHNFSVNMSTEMEAVLMNTIQELFGETVEDVRACSYYVWLSCSVS